MSLNRQSPFSSIVRQALVDAVDSVVVDSTSTIPTPSPSIPDTTSTQSTSALLEELLMFVRTSTIASHSNQRGIISDNAQNGMILGEDRGDEGPISYCFEQLLLRQAYLHMRSGTDEVMSPSSVPSSMNLAAQSKRVFTRPPNGATEQQQRYPGNGCNANEELPMKWAVAVGSSFSVI